MFGFHRDDFNGEDVREDAGQKPAVSKKSWIALIVFCLICVLVIVESIFSRSESSSSASSTPSASAPQKSETEEEQSSSSSLGGQGGLTVTPLSEKTLHQMEHLVSLTLSWRKDNGQVHAVSADQLMKAGMSESLARSYQPVWNTVFRDTLTARVIADQPLINAVEGASADSHDRLIEVRVMLTPSWLASDNSLVNVPSEPVLFKVYWDDAQGKVVRFSEPDPQWLYFAVPEGARPPEVRPDGESD